MTILTPFLNKPIHLCMMKKHRVSKFKPPQFLRLNLKGIMQYMFLCLTRPSCFRVAMALKLTHIIHAPF